MTRRSVHHDLACLVKLRVVAGVVEEERCA